jgi:hypothetical protein
MAVCQTQRQFRLRARAQGDRQSRWLTRCSNQPVLTSATLVGVFARVQVVEQIQHHLLGAARIACLDQYAECARAPGRADRDCASGNRPLPTIGDMPAQCPRRSTPAKVPTTRQQIIPPSRS